MATGVVKFFKTEKGYGFIKRDDNGADIFVHKNDMIAKKIQTDDKVSFTIDSGKQGLKAVDVELI